MATTRTELAAGPSRDAAPPWVFRLGPTDRRLLLALHDAAALASPPALLLLAIGAGGAVAPLVAAWLGLALPALVATDQYALARRRDRALAFATVAGFLGAEAIAPLVAPGPAAALALVAALGATGLALPAGRRALESRLLSARFRRRLLVVGTPDDALAIHDALRHHPLSGDRAIGLVLTSGALPRPFPLLVLGGAAQLPDVARRWRCTEAVAGLGALGGSPTGLRVVDAIAYCSALTGRLPLHRLDARWLAEHLNRPPGRFAAAWSRGRDVAIATLALVLLAPVMAIVGLCVMLTRSGPLFDTTVHLGRDGRPIRLHAFRTIDAGGRETRGTAWLRTTGLARLPRLWAVVTGELSLVGPAPHPAETAADLAAFVPHYARRLAVRPGLTGWAQVRAPFDSPLRAPERLVGHDLYYLQHRSGALDALILARTPWVALARLFAPRPG